MEINTPVKVGDRKGKLIWKDNPYKTLDGKDADILVKVKFNEKETTFFRLSELVKDEDEPINETKPIMQKEKIPFSEFMEIEKKLEIRVGMILNVEDVPKADKLLKLTVSFGDEIRTVVTNIKPLVSIEMLIDQKMAFITNLEPVKIKGIESTDMIMPGTALEEGKIIYINSEVGQKLL
jgi:methionyl-tRNA synthetase